MVRSAPLPVRQIAYFVQDAATSARRHAALFGSGPYYLAERIPLGACRHRGREMMLDHTSAYGQWGDVMIEFVQQNDAAPSPFHDLYADGREGLHHLALFVDDLAAETARWQAQGFPEAFYGQTTSGVAFAMIDVVPLYGHMLELYTPTQPLVALYTMVREAAASFYGGELLRTLKL